ncbi:TetR/AcrR family transcriptional regulator [Amycolatopsis albispora]|uniref:TetR family transcriptional regulator n=1 Tax=Amycolatopsis albispora TaxID=1804986 RepID=A0A344L4Z5_9PSEU|nr:TetR/AcrR family transcriptional regulator [Amycolatopsis albispora]AXB43119.1 TetR family transcriptional regulator [Amycolatopsis albispora]
MDTRTSILTAAADLLAASPVSDVSTRAVCEAAGVGAPTLYRHFGDKEGLLSAVVDHGFERYLAGKRAAKASDDPVRDLRDGWDSHVQFAVRNPAFYRLMHSPAVTTPPEAAAEAMRLLTGVLERCAAAGRLRVPPPIAAQMVMSANVGFALMVLSQPESFDTANSARVRDAIHAAILTRDPAPETGSGEIAAAATRLAALLPSTSDSLSPAETALLREWLTRLA